MDFLLRDSAGGQFTFPVNPEEVTIRREKQYETVNIISLGEIDVPQAEKVKEITFSSFFPAEYDESYCRYYPVKDPKTAMDYLTTCMVAKKPLRLIIASGDVKVINALVLLSAHNTSLKGGEPGDIYFEVTFRTWRPMQVRTATATKPASASKATTAVRSDTKPVPKTYTVVTGDNLSSIAKRLLGSSSKWSAIYEKNKATIGSDPNKIKPGQKLVIP
ncbi:LysM peptidoglycan-binding domain-containing protein [Cohnella nanjingensis]|uniref:LysM peptidoglycan-binding domain-containing protein n=1 Tax=Cohnella nanjingensis TaxID=1387779 RepID=A0A7X0RSU1_9BACL|nr:LysM peptidoglycan-binding domain-containing protein [Cohnella nanjingensis]MBB6673022.1 LysM peptidoglycan-binding domain-containing protein [Cohnella nanjingensis]